MAKWLVAILVVLGGILVARYVMAGQQYRPYALQVEKCLKTFDDMAALPDASVYDSAEWKTLLARANDELDALQRTYGNSNYATAASYGATLQARPVINQKFPVENLGPESRRLNERRHAMIDGGQSNSSEFNALIDELLAAVHRETRSWLKEHVQKIRADLARQD